MVIRSDKIGQSWLLPLDVSELIPEDHICNLVEVLVDNLDVGEIEQKMKANASNNYTLSKEEIESIRRIIARGIAIDKEEDKFYGDKSGDELPSELNTQEKIREKNLRVMWGKLGSSVAALCNIKGLVANFAFWVSSI